MAKILIIEDDPLISKLYREAFSFENYLVVVASDGEEGIKLAKNEKPTLILCDIMMPKMNGIQVLEALKADELTKNIPVVMLTNLDREVDATESLTRGAVKYIIKSDYTPKQITDMVKEIITGYSRNEIPQTDANS